MGLTSSMLIRRGVLGWGACGGFYPQRRARHRQRHLPRVGQQPRDPPAPRRLAERDKDPLAVALGNGIGNVEEAGLVDHVHPPHDIHLAFVKPVFHTLSLYSSAASVSTLFTTLPASPPPPLRLPAYGTASRSPKKEKNRGIAGQTSSKPKRKDPASTSAATSISCLSSVLVSASRTLAPGYVSYEELSQGAAHELRRLSFTPRRLYSPPRFLAAVRWIL